MSKIERKNFDSELSKIEVDSESNLKFANSSLSDSGEFKNTDEMNLDVPPVTNSFPSKSETQSQPSLNEDSLARNPNQDGNLSGPQFYCDDLVPSEYDFDFSIYYEFNEEFSDFSKDDEFASASGFFEIQPDEIDSESDSNKSSYQIEINLNSPPSDQSTIDFDHQEDELDINDPIDIEIPHEESLEPEFFDEDYGLEDEDEFEFQMASDLDFEEYDSVWEYEEQPNRIWTGELEQIKQEITDGQKLSAKRKATEIVEYLDCTSFDEIKSATDFFDEFFLLFNHYRTFHCLLNIAYCYIPPFELIRSVVDLRSAWLENYAGMRAMYLSWMNAYKFCSHLQDNPEDEICIYDWYESILEYYFDRYNWSPLPEFDRGDEWPFGYVRQEREYRNIDDFLEDRKPYVSQQFHDLALNWMHNCDESDTESDDLIHRCREQYGYQIDWHY